MKYIIPAGTLVSVCRVDDPAKRWTAHTTRRELQFDQEYRTRDTWGSSGAVIFREQDWLIMTRWNRLS